MMTNVLQTATLGEQFAHALAKKDASRMRDVLHPDIEFRALTPRRHWEANGRDAVVSLFLGEWFEESDEIDELVHVDSDSFADRQRVGYRFRVSCPDGPFEVEQQAYLSERDGQIGWMRVVCSGYRPAASPE
jgi:ketosteroid isomerase-like protein